MAKGRDPANVEFLRILKDLAGLSSQKDFAKACGKKRGNISYYLSGKFQPGKRVLKDCVENLFGWGIEPLMEIVPITKLASLPTAPGVYVLDDSAGNVLYVGQASSFRSEVRQALQKRIPIGMYAGPILRKKRPKIADMATHLSLYAVPNVRLRHNVEALLLRVVVNQTHNVNIGKFK